jgi:hypothetical protein
MLLISSYWVVLIAHRSTNNDALLRIVVVPKCDRRRASSCFLWMAVDATCNYVTFVIYSITFPSTVILLLPPRAKFPREIYAIKVFHVETWY